MKLEVRHFGTDPPWCKIFFSKLVTIVFFLFFFVFVFLRNIGSNIFRVRKGAFIQVKQLV